MGKKIPICETDTNGDKYWLLKGKLHREDGLLNGKLHREDGPALEFADGSKWWYLNDKLHREDGPAMEFADGSKWWYLNGKEIDCITNKEFLKIVKLKAFW